LRKLHLIEPFLYPTPQMNLLKEGKAKKALKMGSNLRSRSPDDNVSAASIADMNRPKKTTK
jgi:hypothetical protein